MTSRLACAALTAAFVALASNAALARCKAGNRQIAGICEPCEFDSYSLDGQDCRSCPSGFVANSKHTGCQKDKKKVEGCPGAQYAFSGGCMPCGNNEIARAGKCVACPRGQTPSASGKSCAKPSERGACPKGEYHYNGSCMGCGDGSYVQNDSCQRCPKGFTTNASHTGCQRQRR